MTDSRVLAAKHALGVLEMHMRQDLKRQRLVGGSRLVDMLRPLKEAIFACQFYPTPESIAEFLGQSLYDDGVKELYSSLSVGLFKRQDEAWVRDVLFALGLLLGFREKFQLNASDPLPMIDVCWAHVESAFPQKKTKLLVCNVDCGKMASRYYGDRVIKILTNDLKVKAGFKLPVAFFLPKEFFGIMSFGMFAGTENFEDAGEPGSRAILSKDSVGSVLSEVGPLLSLVR